MLIGIGVKYPYDTNRIVETHKRPDSRLSKIQYVPPPTSSGKVLLVRRHSIDTRQIIKINDNVINVEKKTAFKINNKPEKKVKTPKIKAKKQKTPRKSKSPLSRSSNRSILDYLSDSSDDDLTIAPTPTPIPGSPIPPRSKLESRTSNISRAPSPIKLRRTPEPLELRRSKETRPVRSALAKYKILEVEQPKQKVSKSASKKTYSFKLHDVCDPPVFPRFTAFLSTDAQYAMLKSYEDMLRDELSSLFPHMDILPRTSTGRFSRASTLNNFNSSDMTDNRSQSGSEISIASKIKISHFIQTAMKILDIIWRLKQTLKPKDCETNDKANTELLNKLEKQNNPLYLYNEWLNLWNEELL